MIRCGCVMPDPSDDDDERCTCEHSMDSHDETGQCTKPEAGS